MVGRRRRHRAEGRYLRRPADPGTPLYTKAYSRFVATCQARTLAPQRSRVDDEEALDLTPRVRILLHTFAHCCIRLNSSSPNPAERNNDVRCDRGQRGLPGPDVRLGDRLQRQHRRARLRRRAGGRRHRRAVRGPGAGILPRRHLRADRRGHVPVRDRPRERRRRADSPDRRPAGRRQGGADPGGVRRDRRGPGRLGVFPSAALALLAPLAMTFAAQYRVSPLLMGLIILHGVNATAMSPLNSYGAVTKSVLEKSGLADVSIWSVFTLFLAMYVLLMAVVYFAFGGMHLIRHGHGEEPAVDGVDTTVERTKITGEQKVTLLAIAALMVLALGFGLDVGITAFGLGALLTLFFPKRADGAVKGISWSVILLTSGLFVFVGVAKEVGAIDYASNAIGSLGNPLITTLLAFVIGGVVSAFASTTATLGATFPILIPPLQAANFAHIPGAVAGFGVAASVVDVSPTSPSGAMLMANVRNRDKQVYFRQLLSYAGAMLVSGSLVPWFLLVVLGLG
ncbi:hypothetical protein E1288_31105 [Saccharopolyspora elongata]|uniref:Citrate transporter-like domain-containing protein n=2 Tax=Saccharopolyspora elongata TaxID=2530387 RepID=A0A4R4YBF8_9PSEU|nr:hypothetical protein E1288_31105 [Saccharopolyspora elongata]